MNQQNFDRMIGMLIEATNQKKIEWTEDDSHNSFYTRINGCYVTVNSVYDVAIEETSYSLLLANSDDEVFCTYVFNKTADQDGYERLRMLYGTIRDVLYRITESENLILQGLEKALAKSENSAGTPTINDFFTSDKLPF